MISLEWAEIFYLILFLSKSGVTGGASYCIS